jgi:hypothetical protein
MSPEVSSGLFSFGNLAEMSSSSSNVWIFGVLVVIGALLTPVLGVLIVGAMLKVLPNMSVPPGPGTSNNSSTQMDLPHSNSAFADSSRNQNAHSFDLIPNGLSQAEDFDSTNTHLSGHGYSQSDHSSFPDSHSSSSSCSDSSSSSSSSSSSD